ncbi:hypothetical protein NLJ89_g11701 [Agrocybe chaxingu]|uniref:Uncharacterized protein n=1 Tax=Agrocybe chaxingu TaxID=84603 RepID=A0A9W8JNQ0_9AGAR|nr:hypothetical protein NLJ89_g11701 [Agrocybe chaxingu]
MVPQTRSNSIQTMPGDDKDNFYVSEHDTCLAEASVSDSDDSVEVIMEEQPSEYTFVNTDPEAMEKSLAPKSTVKMRKRKACIVESDDDDDEAVLTQKVKKTGKKPVSALDSSKDEDTPKLNMRGKRHNDNAKKPAGKRGKGKGKKPSASENSEGEKPPTKLTIFIYIEKQNPPRTAKGKIEESDKYAQKGPFKLSSNEGYATFLHKVSTALPCPVLHIIQDKIMWKSQTPQNVKPLPMGAETRYSTMIDALKAKKAGARIGIIIMPPPKKPDKDVFWDTDGSGKVTKKGIAQQKERFDKALAPIINELKDGSSGWFYELTDACIGIWASHIACDNATLDTLPQSAHFDQNARIQPKKAAAEAVVLSLMPPLMLHASAPAPSVLLPAAAPVTTPVMTIATTTASTSLIELMILQMLQQQQSVMAARALMTPALAPAPSVPTSVVPLSDASASLNASFPVIPAVPLADFCARYCVDEKDKARLEKLEFQPGDDIDDLGADEWKENCWICTSLMDTNQRKESPILTRCENWKME